MTDGRGETSRAERRRAERAARKEAKRTVDPARLLPAAVEMLQSGQPREAVPICRQVLDAIPGQPDALNLHGIACFEIGEVGMALDSFRSAVAQRPEFADAHNNLGNVLRAIGDYPAAEAAYRDAIACDERSFDGHFNLGTALEAAGRLVEAYEAYRQADALRPGFGPLELNVANVLKGLGRLDEAIAAYRALIERYPYDADALCNLAGALHERGELAAAERACRDALEIVPEHADAHHNLGVVLQALGRAEDAAGAYREAIVHRPEIVSSHVNLGNLRQKVGDLQGAEESFRRAVELAPDDGQVVVNLADLVMERDGPEAALSLCDRYLATHPAATGVSAFRALAAYETDADREVDYRNVVRSELIDPPAGFATLEDFNEALVEHVCTHPSMVRAPARHATRDGGHTGELMLRPEAAVAALATAVRRAVDAYNTGRHGEPAGGFSGRGGDEFRLSMWGVALEPGGRQVPHIHPSAWLSGVYYAAVPSSIEHGEDGAGWIEFGRPPGHFHLSRTPEVHRIRPRPGLLLLFPSSVYHCTVPFGTGGRRVSIAFDLAPTPEMLR